MEVWSHVSYKSWLKVFLKLRAWYGLWVAGFGRHTERGDLDCGWHLCLRLRCGWGFGDPESRRSLVRKFNRRFGSFGI
jgi:hypothetical protein